MQPEADQAEMAQPETVPEAPEAPPAIPEAEALASEQPADAEPPAGEDVNS